MTNTPGRASRTEDVSAPSDGKPAQKSSTPDIAQIRRRVADLEADFYRREIALLVASHLDNRKLTPGVRTELAVRMDLPPEGIDAAIELLQRAGYGAQRRAVVRGRNPGAQKREKLDELLGKLPRSLALRTPTSSDTHRTGASNGTDMWGRVNCNMTLRPAHLSLLAMFGGIWARDGDGGPDITVTVGEIAHVLRTAGRSCPRAGGADNQWVAGLLGDLAQLEIQATVSGPEPSPAHEIPSSPIAKIERLLDGEWLTPGEYERRIEDDESLAGRTATDATVRVRLAHWFVVELRDMTRRAVFVNFSVLRGLSAGTARRLYIFLQASPTISRRNPSLEGTPRGRDLYFYLADPLMYTLGLRTVRRDKAAVVVRHGLSQLRQLDDRYRDGYGQTVQFGTNIPAYVVHIRTAQPSKRRHGVPAGRAFPLRPRTARHGERHHEIHPGIVRDFQRAKPDDEFRSFHELAEIRLKIRDSIHGGSGESTGREPPDST